MKATELMIGDWVSIKEYNKPYKVASLSITGNPELESDKYIFHCQENEIVPIPLTPEILAKNGFSLQSDNTELFKLETYWLGSELGAFRIHRLNNGDYQFGLAKIRNVHELQHALRLCDVRKEVKL